MASDHKLFVIGTGWHTRDMYGSVKRGLRKTGTNIEDIYASLQESNVLSEKIKNFNRFNAASKIVCCVSALALYDAEIDPSQAVIGIIGFDRHDALADNENYFRDYIESGRVMGRGNLFIYTLPSSPLAEASIHCGLTGPVMFMNTHAYDMAAVLDQSAIVLKTCSVDALMVVVNDGDYTMSCVITDKEEFIEKRIMDLDEMSEQMSNITGNEGLIDRCRQEGSYKK